MFKNYFKIAWRNLIGDKQFSFLNLLGLSTGLACTLLIYLWVSDELSIDKYNKNDSRLYEVLKRNKDGTGAVNISKNTQGLLADAMAKEFPEIEVAACVKKERSPGILSYDNKKIKTVPAWVGRNFFDVFTYPLISGSKSVVLADVSNIFLSDKTALKLFNTTNVIGKTIKWDFKDDDVDFSNVYKIAGVFKSPPSNSSDQFDVIFPFELYAAKNAGGMGDVTFWGSNMVSTYVLLRPGSNINAFNNKIKDFTRLKIKSLYKGDDMVNYEGDLFTQRYSDRYLYNNFVNGVQSGGRIEYVKLFSIIAVFILLIACINFMNLSTAKASRRMKEVGIKKVVGASSGSLIFQFISESILMALLSLMIALLFVVLLLPAFKEITGKDISFSLNANLIFSSIVITLLTG
ncbi:MAG: ABC transporter permease, partial [Ginsengibacter sp.]